MFSSFLLATAGLLLPQDVAQVSATSPQEMVEVILHMRAPDQDLSHMIERRKQGAPHQELLSLAMAHEDVAAIEQEAVRIHIEELGGRVLRHYWMINALNAEVPAAALPLVSAHPEVAMMEEVVLLQAELLQSTNASNHNSDAVNLMPAPGGGVLDGTGMTTAIIDTGLDIDHAGSGRPHRAFFVDADTNNTSGGGLSGSRILSADDMELNDGTDNADDRHSHGTSVTGIVGAHDWNAVSNSDDGFAPNAWLRAFRIDSDQQLGAASTGAMTAAYQLMVTYGDVTVSNMSFSGVALPTMAHNRVMDKAVRDFDVLVVLAGGNWGASTVGAHGAINALIVGGVSEGSHNLHSWSQRGPINGRMYPQIVAQGSSTDTTRRDNEAGVTSNFAGTSCAAPHVAGGATLVRQAAPELSAGQATAILLNTTVPANGNPDGLGLGYMKTDAAVQAALAGDGLTRKLDAPGATANAWIDLNSGTPHAVTAVWHRENMSASTFSEIEMRIYDPNEVELAASTALGNLNQKIEFTPAVTGRYRVELLMTDLEIGTEDSAVHLAGVATARSNDAISLDIPDTASVGEDITIQYSNAPEGATWTLHAAFKLGPSTQGTASLDIGQGKRVASGTVPAGGASSFMATIPASVSGRTIYLEITAEIGGTTTDSNMELLRVL